MASALKRRRLGDKDAYDVKVLAKNGAFPVMVVLSDGTELPVLSSDSVDFAGSHLAAVGDVEAAFPGIEVDSDLVLPGHEAVAKRHILAREHRFAHTRGDWGFACRAAAADGCLQCVQRVVRCAGEKVLFHKGTRGQYTALSFARWFQDRPKRNRPSEGADYPGLITYLEEVESRYSKEQREEFSLQQQSITPLRLSIEHDPVEHSNSFFMKYEGSATSQERLFAAAASTGCKACVKHFLAANFDPRHTAVDLSPYAHAEWSRKWAPKEVRGYFTEIMELMDKWIRRNTGDTLSSEREAGSESDWAIP